MTFLLIPFHNFCAPHGISLCFSCPDTSSQNGKSECKIRSINNVIRTLLCHASLPRFLWPHALETSTYLLNIFSSKRLGNLTPTDILYRKAPTYTHLRTFSCLCYPLISSSKITKLQPHSTPCVFLDYPSSHRGYKCYNPSSHKIILSRHVMFDVSVFPFTKLSSSPSIAYDFLDENMHHALIQAIHHTSLPSGPPSSCQPTLLRLAPHELGPASPESPNPPPVSTGLPHAPSTTLHHSSQPYQQSTYKKIYVKSFS